MNMRKFRKIWIAIAVVVSLIIVTALATSGNIIGDNTGDNDVLLTPVVGEDGGILDNINIEVDDIIEDNDVFAGLIVDPVVESYMRANPPLHNFMETNIIETLHESNLTPGSFSVVELTSDSANDDVILWNGICVVFDSGDSSGWEGNAGDTLAFTFESSELDIEKNIIVGYVLDGVMYGGDVFDKVDGGYQMEISEGGVYHIYVKSVASNYLTLKEVDISIF